MISGKRPLEYYAQHVKNLAFFGGYDTERRVGRILALCTGVENLVIKTNVFSQQPDNSLTFFDNLQAGPALRRLYINLWWHTNLWWRTNGSSLNHAYFRNLTHLHLEDDDTNWPFYTGWEHLARLSHLALACSGSPAQLEQVVQALPVVRYVALGRYHYPAGCQPQYQYADIVVNSSPHIEVAWGVRVVILANIPHYDWERGARGSGDFWGVVEDVVERRLNCFHYF